MLFWNLPGMPRFKTHKQTKKSTKETKREREIRRKKSALLSIRC